MSTKEDKNLRRKKRKEKEHKPVAEGKDALLVLIHEDAPLHGCWINQDWQSHGYAYILVARKMRTGLLMFATFWVNIVQNVIEDCFADVNATEDFLQKRILKKNPDISFFAADLSVVKGVLQEAAQKMQASLKPFPKNYLPCIRLVGSWEETIPPVEEEKPEESQDCTVYEVYDLESVEADLRQIPALEETYSRLGYRAFEWREAKRRGLFSFSPEKILLGKVILKEDELLLQPEEEKHREYLQNAILQHLGTSIGIKQE